MKTYTEQIKRPLSKFNCVSNDVHVSIFEGLTLFNYIEARRYVCCKRHAQPCSVCFNMLKVPQKIIADGYMKLKVAFKMVSPNVTYTSLHARRKLLQMLLASLGIGERSKGNYRVFLVEKNSSVHYNIFKSLLNNLVTGEQKDKTVLSRETVDKLLKLAESEGEKQRLKFAIVGSAGLSSTKAKSIYGFDDMTAKTKKVKDALEEATAIREVIENIAKSNVRALLNSLGIYDSDSSETSDNSETDSEQEDADLSGSNDDQVGSPTDVVERNHEDSARDVTEYQEFFNDEQLLSILYQCELNWVKFVGVTGEMQRSQSTSSLESVLNTFATRLHNFHLKECELYVIEQSRQVYNLTKQLNEKEDDIDNGIILSESDCEDVHELSTIKNPLYDKGKEVLKRKRDFIKRKATRDIKKRIAERRFLQRRRSKKVKRLEDECPDIGATIEEFVRKRGVGADAWRRTGVLTFDGNRNLGKKVTFRTIQAHLEAKYHRKISYGTVVQLCIPRNKRRKSAARYKGLAEVTQRRARKGFTLKYNPDSH